jgi:hypothetical protein
MLIVIMLDAIRLSVVAPKEAGSKKLQAAKTQLVRQRDQLLSAFPITYNYLLHSY